jgi:DNA-binding NarL/FixJ family response regulator
VNRAVLIVDDHPVIHEVLREVVRAVYAGATVYSEMDLPGAVRRVRAARRVDLVLLDLGLPGCAGIEALTRFRESAGEVPVAIISACTDAPTVRAALNAGAIGYLPKTLSTKAMVAALRVIMVGGTYVPPEALGGLAGEIRDSSTRGDDRPAAQPPSLTGRQAEILRLLVQGIPNRGIARQLGIAENTVKQHVHTVYQILHVANRTEAAIAAARMHI